MHIDFLKSHKDFCRCKLCAYICMLTIEICCTGREAEKELENDPLVGPPPPSVVAEAESANDAERFEEVPNSHIFFRPLDFVDHLVMFLYKSMPPAM